jgi:acetamidase/formamidase
MILPLLLLFAETHQIRPVTYYNSFDHRHPVLARIKPGDTIVTKTIDAGGYDENGKKAADRGNPLTGPFFIEGAEPGDALEVKIDRLRLNRNYGFTTYRLGLYALNPESIEGIYSAVYKKGAVVPERDAIVKWEIDLAKSRVRLSEPKSSRHKLDFAASPMLGCIGVAAAGVFGPTSGISGPYGGNMDYNRIGAGATVILPVSHPGALLFIGDAHALQGDGEPNGTGVETSMDVTFTVTVRKKANLSGPRVVTADSIISVGSQPEFASSLDRALRLATSDMVDWLVNDYKMEPWAAHLLISYQGRYDVVTVAGSMALRIPKSELPPK